MNKYSFLFQNGTLHSNIWQSPQWAEFQGALGRAVFTGSSEAPLTLIVHKLPFSFCYFDIPRGPLGVPDAAFWEHLQSLATQHNAIFTKISPEYSLSSIPFLHKESSSVFPENTLCINLTQPIEDILKSMKPKGRYNIRLAQKNGVKVEESTDIDAFYKILEDTTDRDGFSSHPKSYYKAMLETLGEKAKLYLASVKEDGEDIILAGGIFTWHEGTCTYYYGASSSIAREKMAPYLVQWTAIEQAKQAGLALYDFLGIAPEGKHNHPLSGVSRFKLQFGGERKVYPKAVDIIHQPFIYTLFIFAKWIRSLW